MTDVYLSSATEYISEDPDCVYPYIQQECPIYCGICVDECDCNGNIEDCSGECGGSAVLDDCGVCNGGGIPSGQC